MSSPRLVAALLLAMTGTVPLSAAEPAGTVEFFEKKIRPLLVENCLKCHGDLKGKEPKGGLQLESRTAALKGGDNGPAIRPGEPDKSKLVEAVRFKNADLQMPPKGKLPEAAIANLVDWVKAGAVWPGETKSPATSSGTFDL